MSYTILVVDDNKPILQLVRTILTEGDCQLGTECGAHRLRDDEVLTADSAEEGLRIGEDLSRPIHLLLADVVMPGMLGNQLAARLRELRPQMRVILMSGTPDGLDVLHDGQWASLEKPFLAAALLERVRVELGKTEMGASGR